MMSLGPESIWPVLIAMLLAMAFVVALTGPARRIGCIDHPGGRKHHAVATPLVGGVAIYLSFLAVTLFHQKIPGESWSLLAAMSVAVAFGLADDLRQVGYRTKFFGQLIAALIVVSGTNVHVMQFGDLFGFGDLVLGKWSYLVTVISIIGLMNAINMIDGLDGLAGTQVLIPLVLFALAAGFTGDAQLMLEISVLAGAVTGFLAFNLRTPWMRRARIFMGDVGGFRLPRHLRRWLEYPGIPDVLWLPRTVGDLLRSDRQTAAYRRPGAYFPSPLITPPSPSPRPAPRPHPPAVSPLRRSSARSRYRIARRRCRPDRRFP
jgi:UDP-N-acetylmuramyl pentapeptide phosphotransferase/UDP-N-acetylglucosamine-1-phosphate transferase